MPTSPTVVMVTDAMSPHTLSGFVDAVRAGGRQPALVTSGDTTSADVDLSGFAGVAVLPDLLDPAVVAGHARRLAGGAPAGLVSWNDSTITVAAEAAELLGVGRCPAAAIARCRNKHAMRRRLSGAGLPVPPFALVGTDPDLDAAARTAAGVGLPAIVKPVNGSGSCLVRRVRSVGELHDACHQVAANAGLVGGGTLLTSPVADPDGQPVDATRSVLVERMLTGPEIDAEVVVHDGTVDVTLLMQVVDPHEAPGGYGFAHPLFDPSPATEQRLVEAITTAVTAMGLDNTMANLTLIDDARLGPTIVEINAGRFGGWPIPRVVFDLTGVDLKRQHIAVTVGDPLPRRRTPPPGFPYAALNIFAGRPGRITAVHGLDRAREHPNVAFVTSRVRPGDHISGLEVVFAVNVLVRGYGGPDGLRALYRELCDIVRVDTEPVSRAGSVAAFRDVPGVIGAD